MIDQTKYTDHSSTIQSAQMHRISACTGGSCQQGRGVCETPFACQLPADEDDNGPIAMAIMLGLAVVFALLALVFAVVPLL